MDLTTAISGVIGLGVAWFLFRNLFQIIKTVVCAWLIYSIIWVWTPTFYVEFFHLSAILNPQQLEWLLTFLSYFDTLRVEIIALFNGLVQAIFSL